MCCMSVDAESRSVDFNPLRSPAPGFYSLEDTIIEGMEALAGNISPCNSHALYVIQSRTMPAANSSFFA